MIERLIGRYLNEELKLEIKKMGFNIRITDSDEKYFFGTCDFKTDRLNVSLDKNLITKAYIG